MTAPPAPARQASARDPTDLAHGPRHLSSPPNIFLTSAGEAIASISFPNAKRKRKKILKDNKITGRDLEKLKGVLFKG